MSDFSFGGGGSIGSFGSCSGADCDCDGCDCGDCDCGDCDCECPDCNCDCGCDCCENCCDEVCFRCCGTIYNCFVDGCSDYVCCCFFQTTTTTTDGRQRSDSYDSYHDYEMHHGSHLATPVPVPITSPPDTTKHTSKGIKIRNGAHKESNVKDDEEKEEDDEVADEEETETSAEELERRVMAGEEVWQPEKQIPEEDLHPTALPIEIGAVTLENSDTFRSEHETRNTEGNAPETDDPCASRDNEQSTSLLGGGANDENNQQQRLHGTDQYALMTGGNGERLGGYETEVGITVGTNYPSVDPPSYNDAIVTTQPGGSSEDTQ